MDGEPNEESTFPQSSHLPWNFGSFYKVLSDEERIVCRFGGENRSVNHSTKIEQARMGLAGHHQGVAKLGCRLAPALSTHL